MYRRGLILAILSGLLLTASFPKISFPWLAWVAFIPWLMALNQTDVKDSFRIGFVAGLAHWLTLIYWVVYTMQVYGGLPPYLSVPVLGLLAAYLSVYFGLFSLGIAYLCRIPAVAFILIPIGWTALEYMRSFLLSGFPWELVGYSQFQWLEIIQISDIFGVYGVSFLIVLFNETLVFIFLYLMRRNWKGNPVSKRFCIAAAGIVIVMLSGTLVYGKWRIRSVDEEASASQSVRVAIVQGNIDQMIKWKPAFQKLTVQKYLSLSHSVKWQHPDIMVWPESATPFYFMAEPVLTEMVLKGIRELGIMLLTGSPSFVRTHTDADFFNSAYLIGRDGRVMGKYDKAHLVPFGEYVPMKRWLPFLGKMVEHVGDFKAGEKGATLEAIGYRIGPLICYEIIFSDLSAAMTKNGAGILMNLTNDAWYGTTSAPYQHFSMAVFRAVENKRSLVRSANTGISGFIDPAGRVADPTPLFEDAVRVRPMPILTQMTFYSRFGDVFARVCIAIMIAALAGFLTKKGRSFLTAL